MAVETEVEVIVSESGVKETQANVENLAKAIDEVVAKNENLSKTVSDLVTENEALKKKVEELSVSTKKQEKSFLSLGNVGKGLGKVFGGVGTALKGIGIGLVIALVAKLTDAFKGNQKVTDALNIAFTAISAVLSKIVNTFIDMAEQVSESTNGFDALRKVIGGYFAVAINTVVIAIQTMTLGVKQAQLAWEQSFLGKKDPKEIARLTKDITGLEKKLGETAGRIKQGGKDIANNFVDAVGELGQLAQGVAEATAKSLSEIDVKAAITAAKMIEGNKKNFEMLALQQARLQLQYQAQAELLRQIRDDDTKNIKDRIKANEELGAVLKKQFNAEAGTIKQRIAALQLEQKTLGATVEKQNEIYQLQTDLIDVGERLTGQQSEQLANRNALMKEEIQLYKTIADNEKARALGSLSFLEEQTKDEMKRLELQRERLSKELEVEQLALEDKRKLYVEGTQARTDAEQEFLNRKQEIDQQITVNDKAQKDTLIKQQIDYDTAIASNEGLTFETRKAALEDQLEQINQMEFESENAKTAALKSNSDARIALMQSELEFKTSISNQELDLALGATEVLKSLGEKNKGIQRIAIIVENAAAIAKIILNTQVANAKALAASPLTGGQPFIGFNLASAGISIAAAGVATVKALSQLGGGSGSTGSNPGTAPNPPQFNIVGQSGTNQLAQTISQQQNAPIKAYTVSRDMSTQQELDRNISDTATFNG